MWTHPWSQERRTTSSFLARREERGRFRQRHRQHRSGRRQRRRRQRRATAHMRGSHCAAASPSPPELTMQDLASLIRAENTSLKAELGNRLARIEHRCDTTALAERAVVQSAAAKNAAAGAASTAGEALRLTKLQANVTDDLQRRMAAFELRRPSAAGAGEGGEPRHLRRVLVLTGFPRDSTRSESLDTTEDLLARLRVPCEEAYTNFRRTSSAKICFGDNTPNWRHGTHGELGPCTPHRHGMYRHRYQPQPARPLAALPPLTRRLRSYVARFALRPRSIEGARRRNRT